MTCERCGREILPGSRVRLIALEPIEDRRILTDDEVLVTHEDCP